MSKTINGMKVYLATFRRAPTRFKGTAYALPTSEERGQARLDRFTERHPDYVIEYVNGNYILVNFVSRLGFDENEDFAPWPKKVLQWRCLLLYDFERTLRHIGQANAD